MHALSLAALVAASLVHDPAHDPKDPHPHAHAPQEAEWRPAPLSETPVYVGEGAHRYRWDASWLQLPEGRDWLGSTHGGMVVDAKGRVFLSVDRGPAILVYRPDGTLERTIGDDWGAGVHSLSLATHRAPDGTVTERLFAANTARQEVVEIGEDGEVRLRLGLPEASGKYDDPSRFRPTGVAVAPNGKVFVADGYGLSWIHRFAADGTYEASFGGPGDGPENLRTPHGLWMETSGGEPTLLVADRENHRIARFALDGRFLGGTDRESGLLRRPCQLQRRGDHYVVADLAGRVTLLDAELKLVAHLGDNPDPKQRAQFHVAPQDWREGVFCAPHSALANAKGEIFVMDWNVAGRITRLVPAPEAADAGGE